MTQVCGSSMGCVEISGPAETEALGKDYAGSFPGAACCMPAELHPYKAAPLQAAVGDIHPPGPKTFEDEYEDEALSA
jgi:hypothetical protein